MDCFNDLFGKAVKLSIAAAIEMIGALSAVTSMNRAVIISVSLSVAYLLSGTFLCPQKVIIMLSSIYSIIP